MAAVLPHASANVVIGGLSLPSGPFTYSGSIYENVVTALGQVRAGVGKVTQIDGIDIATLCSGCELTYRFGGYTAVGIGPAGITYSGGYVNFYLGFGTNNDFDPSSSSGSAADLTAATNGTLFLTLKGHSINASGGTYLEGIFGSNGLGALDVDPTGAAFGNTAGTGAIANTFFDTNSVNPLFGGFADFGIADTFDAIPSSFAVSPFAAIVDPEALPHPGECPGGPECRVGSTRATGSVIPEPEMLSLWGLGLIAFGLSQRFGRSRKNRRTQPA